MSGSTRGSLRLRRPLLAVALTALLGAGVLVGCTDNSTERPGAADDVATPGVLTVSASDTACTLSATTAPAGRITFAVTNTGSKVNEFYLLAADGRRVVGEVENIGPGLSRDLVVQAAPGKYVAACKPGMTGAGIRTGFTVTDSGA